MSENKKIDVIHLKSCMIWIGELSKITLQIRKNLSNNIQIKGELNNNSIMTNCKKIVYNIDTYSKIKPIKQDMIQATENTCISENKNTRSSAMCYNATHLTEQILTDVRSETSISIRSYHDFKKISLFGIPITNVMLNKLCDPRGWLNDEMIDAYFKLLNCAYGNCLLFNCHFIYCLDNDIDVSSWLNNLKGLMNLQHLIFPINIDNLHWYLKLL